MQGTMLGRYRIEAKLGEGGMGVVWRAHDPRLGRDVALKVLPDAMVADATARARLIREARSAAALNHPNILTVYDVGEAAGHVYLALEYVAGESLASRVANGPLAARDAIRIGSQVAAAIAHAHERGIVHRDLKPSNVLLTPEGNAKVLDFGLATRLTGEGDPTRSMGLTEPGMLVGTPPAMAPELWRGAAADARSDQWAFGAMLYAMLSGRAPYFGATTHELSAAILTTEPPALPETAPAGLRAIASRCLARDPAARFGSMAEVRDALAALEGSGAHPTPALAPGRRALRPVAIVAGVAFAAAVIAALVVPALRRASAPARERAIASLAVLPLENFSRNPDQEYFADGMTEELITRLARLGLVRVISRTSVMRFRHSTLSLPEIGRQLGVDAIVEGSVEQAGGRVRITAQLVRASTDTHVWAQSYEREVGDALALQADVAAAIADEVRGTLAGSNGSAPVATVPEGPPRGGGARAVNPAVVQAYLRGRDHYQRWTVAEARQGIIYFDRALALDSTFAPAVAARAMALLWLSSSPDTMAMVRAEIEHALALDSTLGEAHAALAQFLFEHDWNWTASESEFRRAIALNPNDADAHHQYSHLLAALGRIPEAREQANAMLVLDPLAPAAHNHLAWLEYELGNFPASIAADERALQLDPDYVAALRQIADVHRLAHEWVPLEQALGQLKAKGDPVDPVLVDLVRAVERGRHDEALRLVLRMASAADRYDHSFAELAGWYLYLERPDEAMAALESGFRVHDYFTLYAHLDRSLAPLRSDPRYLALRRRMGLPA